MAHDTRSLFGTDGIRGMANEPPITPEVALALGRAVTFVAGRGKRHAPRVIIGKDTRLSGYMIETAIASGICSMGGRVLLCGPVPTPAVAHLTVSMRADAGIVISASHNPFADNGIKVFGGDGFKLPDEAEARIEALMDSPELERQYAQGADIGSARRIDDAAGRYIVFLKKTFPRQRTLEGLRIAIDCANGAAYKVAPTVLEELGADVVAIGNQPNGTNINAGCGATHPAHLAAFARRERADVGIAVDGDADRVILVDEHGEIVDGDQILAMCARELQQRDELSRPAVVGTVMSNLGLERALKGMGLALVRADVGDRYVVEAMLRDKINLGGEQSGHVIFLDHNTTGDGMLTALQVLALMRREERPLSELAAVMQRTPQVLKAVRVRAKPPLDELPTA
ncbi:MAG TPA: phosphoglucosamine mutase, partial [Vicinamibacteria bacterium]